MKNFALKIFFFALASLFFFMIVFFLMTYFTFIPFDAVSIPSQTTHIEKSLCAFILVLLVGAEFFTIKKLISFFKTEIPAHTLTENPKPIPIEFTPPSPPEALVGILSSLAGYNDKGYIWQNDSWEESEKFRAQCRKEIDQLIAEIGEQNFSAEILRKLRSEEVLQDGSGRFVGEMEDFFLANKNER